MTSKSDSTIGTTTRVPDAQPTTETSNTDTETYTPGTIYPHTRVPQ